MSNDLTLITTEIVAAYVSNNSMRPNDLPDLLKSVHGRLLKITRPEPEQPIDAKPEPAVPVKKSIHNDYLVSLIDGKPYKALRRHLTMRGMTLDEYRGRFNLPSTYPMVCKAYSAKRSELAKRFGLGEARKRMVEAPEQEAVMPGKVEAPVMTKRSAFPHSKPKATAKGEGRKASVSLQATA